MNNVKTVRIKDIALLFVCIWCISPPLFINGLARLMALACMILCIINKLYKRDVFIFGAIYVGFTLILGSWNNTSYLITSIQLYILVAMAFLADNYLDVTGPKLSFNIEFISKAINIIYPVWMVRTIIAYGTIQNISRIMANNENENVESWSASGIGGYGMIYSLVLYSVILLFEMLNCSKKRFALILINYILSVITVIMAGYSIALIGVVVGALLVLLIKGKETKNILTAVLISIVAILIWSAIKEYFASFVTNIASGTLYEDKVNDVIDSITGQEATGTLKDRTDLYAYSWQGFLSSPIFGTIASKNPQIGGHSLLLDTLARFGLIGFITLLYILLYLPITCIRKNVGFTLSLALMVTMIFVISTNTVSAAMAPIAFVYYPYVLNKFKNVKNSIV